jgi:hypothetical protein
MKTNSFFNMKIIFKHNRVPGTAGNPLCEDVLVMFTILMSIPI